MALNAHREAIIELIGIHSTAQNGLHLGIFLPLDRCLAEKIPYASQIVGYFSVRVLAKRWWADDRCRATWISDLRSPTQLANGSL